MTIMTPTILSLIAFYHLHIFTLCCFKIHFYGKKPLILFTFFSIHRRQVLLLHITLTFIFLSSKTLNPCSVCKGAVPHTIESWNGLRWKGPLKIISFQPLAVQGIRCKKMMPNTQTGFFFFNIHQDETEDERYYWFT